MAAVSPPGSSPITINPQGPRARKRRWIRAIGKRLLVLALVGLAWLLWNPGTDLRDGRHDRRENGIWLAHGWLGADQWFRIYDKEVEKPSYRSPEALAALASRLRQHGIHLPPGGSPARISIGANPISVRSPADAITSLL